MRHPHLGAILPVLLQGRSFRSGVCALLVVVALVGTACGSASEADSEAVVVDGGSVEAESDEATVDSIGSSSSVVGEDGSEDVGGREPAVLPTSVCLPGGGVSGEGTGESAGLIAFTRFEHREAFVVDAEGGVPLPLGTGGAVPVWSPDGSSVAFISRDEIAGGDVLSVVDARNGNLLHKTGRYSFISEAGWSPDGSRLAFEVKDDGQYGLLVMDLDSKKVDEVFADRSLSFYSGGFAWSPDGSRIAVVENEEGVLLISMDGPDVGATSFVQVARAFDLLWSPDNSRLAVFGWDVIQVVDVESGHAHELVPGASGRLGAWDMRWSPDGSQIAFSDRYQGENIYVVDATGENLQKLTDNDNGNRRPVWSPDGTLIAFLSTTRQTRVGYEDVLVMSSDGRNVRNLTEDLRGVYDGGVVSGYVGRASVQWSPDGTRIALTGVVKYSPEVLVIDVESGAISQLTDNNDHEFHVSWSPDGERISFVLDPVPEVFVMRSDGSDQRRLTREVRGEHPLWSPDGALIAFQSLAVFGEESFHEPGMVPARLSRPFGASPNQVLVTHSPRSARSRLPGVQHSSSSPDRASITFGSEVQVAVAQGLGRARGHLAWSTGPVPNRIFVIRSDGTELRQIPKSHAWRPTWSPDSSRIAFDSSARYGPGIFIADVDGSQPRPVAGGYSAEWSPIGDRIAFLSPPSYFLEPQGKKAIQLINGDGSQQEQLTNNTEAQRRPAWSPDGSHIAYVNERIGEQDQDNKRWDIYLIDLESRESRQLTDRNFQSVGKLVWSPDGCRIAFNGNDGDQNGMFMLDIDDASLSLYTSMVGSPSWSPDGSRIVFASNRDGGREIFTIDSDGQNIQQLTHNDYKDSEPVWSPATGLD